VEPVPVVTDHPAANRYELHVGDELVAVADYRREGRVTAIPHVETKQVHRDNGRAAQLMAGVLDDLRARSMTIRPLCPFAATYVREHPEDHDLVEP
jgi:predicted GNAT family acetyltransferase